MVMSLRMNVSSRQYVFLFSSGAPTHRLNVQLRLMNFIRVIGRDEIYIKYVHQLVNVSDRCSQRVQ
jgi:hypothetical protein